MREVKHSRNSISPLPKFVHSRLSPPQLLENFEFLWLLPALSLCKQSTEGFSKWVRCCVLIWKNLFELIRKIYACCLNMKERGITHNECEKWNWTRKFEENFIGICSLHFQFHFNYDTFVGGKLKRVWYWFSKWESTLSRLMKEFEYCETAWNFPFIDFGSIFLSFVVVSSVESFIHVWNLFSVSMMRNGEIEGSEKFDRKKIQTF